MTATAASDETRHFMVRPGTLDDFIVESVFVRNEYRLPACLPHHTVVIDIGAHIGAFALAAVDRGAQHVLAVEAVSENRVLAALNMRDEIASGQVELSFAAAAGPLRAAVSMGPAPLHSGKVNTGGHRIAGFRSDLGATDAVRVITLDDLIRRAQGELGAAHLWLKLDCESSEWEILGTCTLLAALDRIVGEYHEVEGQTFGPQLPCTAEGLVALLRSAGFSTTVERDLTTPGMGLFWATRDE